MRLPVLLATLLICGACTSREVQESRKYALPTGEAVRLRVPKGWADTVTNSSSKPVVTIQFAPQRSDEGVVLITFGPPQGTNSLRANVEEAAGRAMKTSGQSEIEIREIKSKSVQGYYFSVADEACKPGEWKYLTQGIASVGDVMCAFTILTNDRRQRSGEKVLSVVRSAVYAPTGTK